MPRLILLNGPPGIGKSTLARRYAADHPPALALDVDRVRDLIGGDLATAGVLARDIAVAAARTHLSSGHDVVIPQYLGRLPFVERLARLAAELGVPFHEVVLLDTLENSLHRYAERGGGAAVEELVKMHHLLRQVVEVRSPVVIPTAKGEETAAYQALLAALAEPPPAS